MATTACHLVEVLNPGVRKFVVTITTVGHAYKILIRQIYDLMLHHSSSFDDNKRWNNLACGPDTLNKSNKLAIVSVIDKDRTFIFSI